MSDEQEEIEQEETTVKTQTQKEQAQALSAVSNSSEDAHEFDSAKAQKVI